MVYIIPDHVWSIILPFLKTPHPTPLSCSPRSALRQVPLTKAMRVCKLFASICQPLLYGPILITHDLPSLLHDIKNPIMHSRFSHTLHLRLEYKVKGAQGGYEMLMNIGGDQWKWVGMSVGKIRELILQQRTKEAGKLASAMRSLSAVGARKVFCRIETVAVGSIYGSENVTDWLGRKGEDPNRDKDLLVYMKQCTKTFNTLLKELRLQHFCIRDSMGPFGIPPISDATQDDPEVARFACTIHFNKDTMQLPIILGARIQWIIDFSGKFDDLGPILDTLSTRMGEVVNVWRGRAAEMNPRTPVDIDLYCLTGAPLLKDINEFMTREKVIAWENEGSIEAELRKASKSEDEFRWYTMELISLCPSCGSHY